MTSYARLTGTAYTQFEGFAINTSIAIIAAVEPAELAAVMVYFAKGVATEGVPEMIPVTMSNPIPAGNA